MKTALIGYTGFVGSNIKNQMQFDDFYNSKNISDIKGKKYDLVICAGVKAVKWWSNKHPEEDLEGINNLIENIKTIDCSHFILISTIDVYPNPVNVNEDFDFNSINQSNYHAYGKNRLFLENFVQSHFSKFSIIRLPGLFGNNLKKNIIYDLLNDNMLENIIPNLEIQYYNLDNIGKDIQIVIDNSLEVVNFNSEPIQSSQIISLFGAIKVGENSDNPIKYNCLTKYSTLFGGKNGYIYSKEEIFDDIKRFITSYKKQGNSQFQI